MIDFPTLYPSLTKYLPNWLERFYPSIARFGKGDGYPCGNQGVFIPKNRKCWTHPKTGQKLKKPLTYQMYQEAKAKSQKSRTEKGRTALERREQELRQLNNRQFKLSKTDVDDDMLMDLFREDKTSKSSQPRRLFLESKSKQVDITKNRESLARLEKIARDQKLSLEAKIKREKLVQMLDDLEAKGHGNNMLFRFRDPTANLYPKERSDSRYKAHKRKLKALLSSVDTPDQVISEQERMLQSAKTAKQYFDDFIKKARRLVQVDNPTRISVKTIAGSDIDKRSIQRGVDAFSKLIDIPEIEQIVTIVNDQATAPTSRAHYDIDNKTVFLSKRGKIQPPQSEVIHELGHWLEDTHPEIQDEVDQFYRKRTKGEPLVKLKQLIPANGLGEDEITRRDKFVHPYIGKHYNVPGGFVRQKGVTEVLSMGLELMHENPAYLAKKDPEMFDFIYKVVRRGIRRK